MEEDFIYSAVNLKKTFSARGRRGLFQRAARLNAVDGVTFDIRRGETFGLVGESGCGKTTTGRILVRLEHPTSGDVLFNGESILKYNRSKRKGLCRKVQMIFQDPYSALHPLKDVRTIVKDPLVIHNVKSANGFTKDDIVREMLSTVGLPTTEDFLEKRPQALSGGEQQRVVFARALLMNPDFIVCDEPVSMLDASLKAEIVGLLMRLKEEKNLTYLFITHELGVAYVICDRFAVMYLGNIVEMGSTNDIARDARHPYTKLLLQAIPPMYPDPKWADSISEGEIPHQTNIPSGCKFHPRCEYARDICKQEAPRLQEVKSGHYVACHEKL